MEAEEARVKNGVENSPVEIISDVTDCILSALKKSTNLITSTKKKQRLSPDIVLLNGKIQEVEKIRTNILKANRGSSASLSIAQLEELKTLTQVINSLRLAKDETFKSQTKTANKKTQKVTNSKGRRTGTFWKVINPQEDEAINSLKTKDGKQTTTQEETLSRAQEHYQELFTPRQRPPNKEPAKIPSIGK